MAAPAVDRPLDEARVREIVDERLAASIRHCSLCGTSPIGRVVACTDVDCPACIPEAA